MAEFKITAVGFGDNFKISPVGFSSETTSGAASSGLTNIFLGANAFTQINVGSSQVSAIYVGSTQVWGA